MLIDADIAARLAQLWPPEDWRDVTVLAAVSGGADSVALLRGLHAIRGSGPGRLIVAHFNHALRAEADDDEAFVRQLAASLELAVEVGRAERKSEESPSTTGVEEAARRERYRFLRAAAAHVGARFVVTAHTADDQAETVLHRILRGTGIAGLAGIRRARPLCHGVTLLRPLLTVRRADLLAYLRQLGQPFREDATNIERSFTRNRLRHDLLPQLSEQYNPRVAEALLRLSQLADEAQGVVDAWVAERLPGVVAFQADRMTVARSPLTGQPRYLVRELLVAAWRRQAWPEQAMGFAEWEALTDDLLAPAAKNSRASRLLPGRIAVRWQGDLVVLERGASAAGSNTDCLAK